MRALPRAWRKPCPGPGASPAQGPGASPARGPGASPARGLVRALPRGLVRALPGGLVRALPGGLVRALPRIIAPSPRSFPRTSAISMTSPLIRLFFWAGSHLKGFQLFSGLALKKGRWAILDVVGGVCPTVSGVLDWAAGPCARRKGNGCAA